MTTVDLFAQNVPTSQRLQQVAVNARSFTTATTKHIQSHAIIPLESPALVSARILPETRNSKNHLVETVWCFALCPGWLTHPAPGKSSPFGSSTQHEQTAHSGLSNDRKSLVKHE